MVLAERSVHGLRVVPTAAGDRTRWDEMVLQRCGGNIMQSWGWGDLKEAHGWRAHRVLALDGADHPVGGVQVLTRPLPGRIAFAYAPRGPAVPDPVDHADVALALIEAAREVARSRRALWLKLDPEWSREDTGVESLRRTAGLRDNAYDVQHRRTYIVDLEGGEEAVMGRIKTSTRRHIRRAERGGVEITVRHDPAAIGEYYPLFAATAARKGFIRREADYYRAMVAHLSTSCPVAVIQAWVEGEAVSGMIAAAAGPRLIFLFGGSTLRHSDRSPAYLMHWTAIRWGLERGCRFYDMWGVPNHEDSSLPGAGYFEFKKRWNGWVARHHRCQDVPLWPALGPLPRAVERVALRNRPFAA